MKISLSPFVAIVTSLLFVQCDKDPIQMGDVNDYSGVLEQYVVKNTLTQTCYTSEFRGTYTHYSDTTFSNPNVKMTIYFDLQDSTYYFYANMVSSPDSTRVYFDSTGVAKYSESYSAPQGTSSRMLDIRLQFFPYGVYANWKYSATVGSDPSVKSNCYYEGPLY